MTVSARSLGAAAVVTACAGALLLLTAVEPAGPESGDDGWLVGLFLLMLPVLAALAGLSVAGSALRRPVGIGASLLAAFGAVLHVAVAVDSAGAPGWVVAAPTLAATFLLAGSAAVASPRGTTARPEEQLATGPPLDVAGSLRDARHHAVRAVVAWLVVAACAGVIAVPVLAMLGWPAVTERLEARVVDIRAVGDGWKVSFEAPSERGVVRWEVGVDDHEWEIGERFTAYLDDDERVHFDAQFGRAGLPLLMPVLLPGFFAAVAARRVWGIALASVDVQLGSDRPRMGYMALIDDPLPRTWRPLLAVWARDPTTGPRLEKPDAVYRADDETGEQLQCQPSDVVVHRAWIDTGRWRGASPRWVGAEHGVAIPHRRALLGRWRVRTFTRRAKVREVVGLHHGPPDPSAPVPARRRSRHSLGGMVAWRSLALVASLGLAFVNGADGHRAAVDPASRGAP